MEQLMKQSVNLIAGCLLLTVASVASALEGLPDFTGLVSKNHQAVVNISTVSRSEPVTRNSDPGEMPDLGNPLLEELLKKYWEEEGGGRSPAPSDPGENSLGSGFIISPDGYVLTNNHVVANADEVIVRLSDRRQLVAEVIGTDPRSDVALLKLDATDLPVVTIGSADALKVGEWVLAIGSPFGFDFSVTAGIVSAKGRSLPNENYVPFIQTDVAINPGNSGGPLFNLRGEVIGVNSQIYSRTGGFMGLSFAIPIELAMDVADQLKTGKVSRGWLGVVIQEVTRELAQSFGMRTAFGALVARILPDSPAADSDLEVGDIITHFNGSKVTTSSALPPLVGQVRANNLADLKIIRNGSALDLQVRIGELPGSDELRRTSNRRPPSDGNNPFKIKVTALDDAMRESLGVDLGGVLVTEVVRDGPADKAGIKPGVALLRVDNAPVDSIEEFDQVVAELDGSKPVAVLVHSEQGPEFLALKIESE